MQQQQMEFVLSEKNLRSLLARLRITPESNHLPLADLGKLLAQELKKLPTIKTEDLAHWAANELIEDGTTTPYPTLFGEIKGCLLDLVERET